MPWVMLDSKDGTVVAASDDPRLTGPDGRKHPDARGLYLHERIALGIFWRDEWPDGWGPKAPKAADPQAQAFDALVARVAKIEATLWGSE